MQQNMMAMLPLLMSMSGKGESGSGGQIDPEMMLRLLAPEMFEEDVEPLFEEGVTVGHSKYPGGSENVGVLSVRLLPPTLVSAKPTLRLTTTGVIYCKQGELRKVGSFLTRLADDKELAAAIDSSNVEDEKLKPQRTMLQAAKAVTK